MARLLSGRFKFERLSRFFTPSNRLGLCGLPGCWDTALSHDGDLASFILLCPSLHNQRTVQLQIIEDFCLENPQLNDLIGKCMRENQLQFFLDCTVLSDVILEVQLSGLHILYDLLKLTRNYIFALFKTRSELLKVQN